MKQISDEQLLAYLDGELKGDALNEFQSLIASDPSIKARLDIFREMECSASDSLRRTAPETLTLSVMKEVLTQAPVHPQAEYRSNGALYVFLALIGTFIGIALLFPSEQAQTEALSPVGEWFRTVHGFIGDKVDSSGRLFTDMSSSMSDTMMLAVVAIMLLILLDMYILRPLFRKN